MSRLLWLVPMLAGVAACARPPHNLAGDFPSITVADAQQGRDDGTPIRWGGLLVQATPKQGQTCFEIVSRPLDRSARPIPSDETSGRFLACAPGFYDPSVYAPGRDVTVVGTLRGQQTRKVGDFEYRFPLVDARAVQLWEVARPQAGPTVGVSIGGVFGGW